jgi:hypothetical protein
VLVSLPLKKKKMVKTFGDQYATASDEGVVLGRGSGKKYRVKWTNLREELECDYGAVYNLLRDPAAVRPQKKRKFYHSTDPALNADGSSCAGLNNNDSRLSFLSDPEVS